MSSAESQLALLECNHWKLKSLRAGFRNFQGFHGWHWLFSAEAAEASPPGCAAKNSGPLLLQAARIHGIHMRVSKIEGTILGVPIIRSIIFGVYIGVPLILGKYYIDSHFQQMLSSHSCDLQGGWQGASARGGGHSSGSLLGGGPL